jgi:aspartokinase-like uncharacterized kinase
MIDTKVLQPVRILIIELVASHKQTVTNFSVSVYIGAKKRKNGGKYKQKL